MSDPFPTGAADPFATAAIRERVLAAWTASPARFREDANTEEDLALGGYRDRLIVELAQNAADAATRAGVAGRLRLTLRDDPGSRAESGGPVLVAANTGAHLTAEGVEALATLRASAKRDEGPEDEGTVGRFGVGFSAVLAVTDDPVLLSRTGGVRFSREDTVELVSEAAATAPGLADEVRRRSGHVPILRLPFAAEGEPPAGFDSAVVLPLRDEAATDLTRRVLAEVDDALLLALPGLTCVEIDVEGAERIIADATDRWHVHRVGGVWTPAERAELLAARPTEERARPMWSVLWAIPRDPSYDVPRIVHAPTPTDEPLSLPALLLATFPLDPARRHVATGPLTDRLVVEAATAYAELAHRRAENGASVVGLVPVGLPVGALDGALRGAILRALPGTPLLPAAEGGALLRPRDAIVVEGAEEALVRVLAPVVDGLVESPPQARAAFDALGVRRTPLAELVDDLAEVAAAHPPTWWREVYAALDQAVRDPLTREALGALPVPLVDGRTVRGARGLLVPGTGELPAEALAVLASYGLRIVHPDAVQDTLERLGALPASARTLLEDGAVRAAVEDSAEADDPAAVADGVLALVRAAVEDGQLEPGDLPWLGDLALPDGSGQLTPASALVVPASEAEAILDPEEFGPVDGGLLERFGAPALEAVGVLRTLGLVSASDVDLDAVPDELADLADVDDWAEAADLPAGSVVGELVAVRDLDVVREEAWPEALRLLVREPSLRRALSQPVRATAPDGGSVDLPSYTAWWIRRNVRIGGRSLGTLRDQDADPVLAALLEEAPDWLAELDAEARRMLGVVGSVADLDAHGLAVVLDRLSDESLRIDAAALLGLWEQLGTLEPTVPRGIEPPSKVRVLDGTSSRVVDAQDAVIVDAPMWLQRHDIGGQVVAVEAAAEVLAELLDLSLAREVADGRVDDDGGVATPVPAEVSAVLPGAPATWWEHDDLRVDGQPVEWWVDDDGHPHAATGEGFARALAWAAGRWERRHLVAVVTAEPDRTPELLAETSYD